MRRPKTKPFFLPVLGLLAAVLVLLVVVAVTTFYNLEHSLQQAQGVLSAQSTAIVYGMAAGLRTGGRHWDWRGDPLQGLVHEMSQIGDVTFIALLNRQGLVLAHSDKNMIGRMDPQARQAIPHLSAEWVNGWFFQDQIYLAGKILRPNEIGLPPLGGEDQGHMMMRNQTWLQNERLRPRIILVGLKIDAYKEDRHRQIQHAWLMAGLLFLIGSGAIYLIFLRQNYRTIDRTLETLSTYTSEIVNNMPNGLITLDAEGRPVMVNQAARDMFGWKLAPEKDLVDEPVILALSREFRPVLQRGEKVLEREFDITKTPHGPLPLAVSAAAVPDWEKSDSAPGAVFILRDLRQIRSLENKVRQSEKLAAVGRLAAGLAHEVRNPLSSMRGLARFLARGFSDRSREAEYLKVMVEEIDRLDRVMTSLLDFARPRQPNLKPLDLNQTARHTLDLISDDAKHRGIHILEDMAPEAPLALADRDQVVQAMLNIMLNAVEAMPEGGKMTVITKKDREAALFAVEDTGPGIPPEDRSRLFDPFFTTKKKGTGLGLAQVAGIMEAHGGRVEISGAPGMGVRVSLYFALAPDERLAESEASEYGLEA